ncbi:DEAD/DEAH box helicase OS=Cellulomonas persica OX=76861 GN=CPE01_03100 PE=3 SV=1 [Cellulomonas persica]
MPATLADRIPADPTDPDALYEAFTGWAAEQGLTLYPHQEESLLELVTGSHVILSTPTGSGKSLVATAAHFVALAQGRRTFYTAPLKALVSEKFFALVAAFGSQNVGMMTGDSAVNPDAPIICCTAEILANLALRDGADADARQVVMDEFHFYSDPQRGWAWQVPLLELPHAQFVLMSATLGDVTFFADDLRRRTGGEVAVITNAERPVPLTFSYVVEPLHDVLDELVRTRRAPVYVVHFTQKEAVERAQSLLSAHLTSREQRDAIAAELGAFRFGPGFGKTLSRLLRHGVGVHHAGMLPKYRRVVERLTQRGLLPVVCGTDTLGVGINVPIRTVVLTSLVKYDGQRMRHLSAREFHQIAGRAGRAGFDTVGEVVVMAPEHVIENRKALERAGDDPRKLKKIVRKQAPSGHVNWTDKTFERLRDAPPEPLTSSFAVTHAMVLHVLARGAKGEDPVVAMTRLLADNHEPEGARGRHVRQAVAVYRSLRAAGVVERVWVDDASAPKGRRRTVRLTHDLPANFALNQALSPFAYAALELLDRTDPAYAHDVVSVLEATLDDPRQVLAAQENKARGEAVAAMKADGLDYDERMALLEGRHLPAPPRRPALGRVRDVPHDEPVGRRPRALPQVGGPRDARARRDVRGVRQPLHARPHRGRAAALPGGRLPGAASDRPGRRAHRGAVGGRRVARRPGAPHGLEPAGRVGAPRQPARRARRRRAGWGRRRHARADHREPAGVPRTRPRCVVPPRRARRA